MANCHPISYLSSCSRFPPSSYVGTLVSSLRQATTFDIYLLPMQLVTNVVMSWNHSTKIDPVVCSLLPSLDHFLGDTKVKYNDPFCTPVTAYFHLIFTYFPLPSSPCQKKAQITNTSCYIRPVLQSARERPKLVSVLRFRPH